MNMVVEGHEVYPVFFLEEINKHNTHNMVEIPEDKIAWVRKVEEEFQEMQDYLESL